jgi:hypothetical protein
MALALLFSEILTAADPPTNQTLGDFEVQARAHQPLLRNSHSRV